MHLSKRLQSIADMVTEGNTLIDVGCDHGYLPIYLVKEKKIPKAIAMDIVAGPIERARENIRANGLEEYIQTRQTPGLAGVKPGEGETLVIAGMGGPLIIQILTEHMDVVHSFRELILQPQSDIAGFRAFLEDQNLEIVDEDMILEDGKYYTVIKVQTGKMHMGQKELYLYGPCLLKKKHPVLLTFLEKEKSKLDELEQHLEHNPTPNSVRRLEELREEQQCNLTARRYYEL